MVEECSLFLKKESTQGFGMRWDRKMESSEEGWQSQMSHVKRQSIQSQSPLRKLRILYCIGKSHYPPL